MRGTVTRWGSRGYGFIRPDDLDVDAWVHYRFLAEPDWAPRGGERVEFELKELPDGRYQAWSVRPARHSLPPPPAERVCAPGAATDRLAMAPGASGATLGTLGEALVRAGHARVEASVGRHAEPAAEPPVIALAEQLAEQPPEQPAVPVRLEDRLTVHREGAEQTSAVLAGVNYIDAQV